MKFIVISGSARFMTDFVEQYIRIACEGDIPYGIAGNCKDRADYPVVKPLLDASYLEVIRQYADELFVLNVGGYIGESTRAEINVALAKGIPVRYLVPSEVNHAQG